MAYMRSISIRANDNIWEKDALNVLSEDKTGGRMNITSTQIIHR